mmetsp:Transcript_42910/g.115323  ORF Transcript_42910/g.115323 Transcript_42910/m.115323 type:complete len:278 (-) Transcript_42910:346-1179(-)
MKATSQSGRKPSVFRQSSSLSNAWSDSGPKISSGTEKRVNRRSKNEPAHMPESRRESRLFAVPGEPSRKRCSPESAANKSSLASTDRSMRPFVSWLKASGKPGMLWPHERAVREPLRRRSSSLSALLCALAKKSPRLSRARSLSCFGSAPRARRVSSAPTAKEPDVRASSKWLGDASSCPSRALSASTCSSRPLSDLVRGRCCDWPARLGAASARVSCCTRNSTADLATSRGSFRWFSPPPTKEGSPLRQSGAHPGDDSRPRNAAFVPNWTWPRLRA